MKKLITVTILLTQSLLCMDVIWHNPNIKNSTHLQLAQRYFDHDSICALALVNRKWSPFIKETAGHRRQFLASQEEYRKERYGYNAYIYRQTTWHKHNSAYSYWKEVVNACNEKEEKQIALYLVHLDGNNNIKTKSTHIPHLPNLNINRGNSLLQNPYFNNKGNVSYHFYELFPPDLVISYRDLVINEYVLSTKKETEKFNCYVDIMHKNNSRKRYAKENIANIDHRYPLLNAIIDSKCVTKIGDNKIYHIDGVQLDEDYLLNGKFPLLTGEFDCSAPRVAQRALISRCIIKNEKIFLLLCAQYSRANIIRANRISLLPLKVIKHIGSFMINAKK